MWLFCFSNKLVMMFNVPAQVGRVNQQTTVFNVSHSFRARIYIIKISHIFMSRRLDKNNLGFSHVFSANLSYILSNILCKKFPICI